MSAEKQGVELPAIDWLVQLGYTHLSGSAVQVTYRHLAPVLEEVLRPRLLALNPWLATAPGGVDAALIELRKRVHDDLLSANQAFWEQVLHRSDIQLADAQGVNAQRVFSGCQCSRAQRLSCGGPVPRSQCGWRGVSPRPAAVCERAATGHH